MHIGLYSPAWPLGGTPNGIVTYVHAMQGALRAKGHRVSIVSSVLQAEAQEGVTQALLRDPFDRAAEALSVSLLKRPPSIRRYGRAIADAFQQVHDSSPLDVIEMEESFGFAADVAARVPAPVVVKLHGPAFLHLVEEELRTRFGQEKVEREGRALRSLPFVTSPSACHLADTVAFYGLSPLISEHIVNPLDLPPSAPQWRLEGCDPRSLLFVGRFDKVKGGDLVLKAFQSLLKSHPGLRLTFVGPDRGLIQDDGSHISYQEFVSRLEDPALEASVIYGGQLEPAEIIKLRTESLCTLVASRRESQGYTALEAMAQGCPVVCADTSGLSEIVEHEVTGLKARAEDAAALAAQLDRIVCDPRFGARLGAAARIGISKRHSPESVADQTLSVYRRAIGFHADRVR